MSIINDFSLFWPFMIKGLIVCIIIPIIGYAISEKFGYHGPEDDVEGEL